MSTGKSISLTQNTFTFHQKKKKTANSAHLERELVHEVDLVRVGDVAVLEVLDRHGERGAEEADLPLPGAVVHQLLQHGLELGREELVRLMKRKRAEDKQPGQSCSFCERQGIDTEGMHARGVVHLAEMHEKETRSTW